MPDSNTSRFGFAGHLTGDTPRILTVRRPDDAQPRPDLGTITEPARDVPVYAECQVLVVGGGPAGCAAAIASARAGADTLLVERYGHLGGLSTGGLVIWIDRMTDWEGRQVICGFACDVLDRLPRDAVSGAPQSAWGSKDEALNAYWGQRLGSFRGTVTWSPLIDPEWLKLESLRMAQDAGVRLLLHAWVAAPIMEGGNVAGAVFESKEGRLAIRANVVVDASGDGDVYARAGARFDTDTDQTAFTHACMNTGWLWAGVDMERWLAFRANEREKAAELRDLGRQELGELDFPYVSWRKDVALFLGPRMTGYSPVNVDDLTAVEVESRKWLEAMLKFYRAHAPGFEDAWILESAQQVGVRHSRRLNGLNAIQRSAWEAGQVFDDEVGVSPSLSPTFPAVSVPYGSLVAADVDGILAPGRHVSCDASSHTFMREIPQCWLTGQAAGVGAAIAARADVPPRSADVRAIQRELLRQGAYIRAAS
ncbi:MAG TPA: FAD-dependent oxidoreductase [Chloroflexota bacterium]|jgi:hypothetical protein|nr:FAD-dependent oxidoreductase [Chloroflexota bacterium]